MSEGPWDMLAQVDAAVCDVDGVVCLGDTAIPGAAEAIDAIRASGLRIVFVTNDSRRSPEQQRSRLAGVATTSEPVITAIDAVVAELRSRGHQVVAALGSPALLASLASAGLSIDVERATALVVGWVGELDQTSIASAVALLDAGVEWLATNDDDTVPAARGPIADTGPLLRLLAERTGRSPFVCGKPHRPISSIVHQQLGGTTNVVVIGDGAETDMRWAALQGWKGIRIGSSRCDGADLVIPSLSELAVVDRP